MNIWEILDTEPTRDKATIRKAYARRLRLFHPEEDPVGYQQLREAYDHALRIAEYSWLDGDDGDDDDGSWGAVSGDSGGTEFLGGSELLDFDPADEDAEPQDPLNPVRFDLLGQNTDGRTTEDDVDAFMEQLDQLYRDYSRRIRPEEWAQVLNDPLLWNLETQHWLFCRCTSFLSEHHYLPLEVWQELDGFFQWSERMDDLEYLLSEDMVAYVLRQARQGLPFPYEGLESLAPEAREEYLGLREAAAFALMQGDALAAYEALKQLRGFGVDDISVTVLQGHYDFVQKMFVTAYKYFDQASELPECDSGIRMYMARLLKDVARGRTIRLCRAALAHEPAHKEATLLLVHCHMQNGDLEDASQVLVSALEQSPNNPELLRYAGRVTAVLWRRLSGWSLSRKRRAAYEALCQATGQPVDQSLFRKRTVARQLLSKLGTVVSGLLVLFFLLMIVVAGHILGFVVAWHLGRYLYRTFFKPKPEPEFA